MKVKRFLAKDTATALALVKEELGEEAVILSTRRSRSEPGGRTAVEVVAAVDFDVESLTRGDIHEGGPSSRPAPPPPPRTPEPLASLRESAAVEAKGTVDLRHRVDRLLRQFRADGTDSRPEPGPPPAGRVRRPDPQAVARWRSQVIESIEARPILAGTQGAPAVIAVVGPTGVGKTTTAAKLAAWFSIHEGVRVGLITTDCYRIGATDQIRTYARIMNLPCEVCLRPQDLRRAIERHRDRDVLIIDTAGKSPFDPDHIDELHKWFGNSEVQPYLVLSATSKKEDLAHVVNVYKPLNPAGVMVTKVDETRAYAAICQQLASSRLPLACLGTGQRVPEDFLMASKDFLRLLFGKGWEAAMIEGTVFAATECRFTDQRAKAWA